MVCAEPVRPYDRPPLSKGLLAGTLPSGSVWLRPKDWYADHEVELMLGLMGVRLDPVPHVLVVSGGRRISYEKLLIATGARARQLPFLRGYRNVHTVRTVFDVERLRSQLVPGSRLAIVGAGFIGQEIASTARRLGVAGHDDRGSGDPPCGHPRRAGRSLVRASFIAAKAWRS